jgi:TIR domain
MSAIFVSYRRDDSRAYAGRLEEDLKARFGKQSVFRDKSDIPAGNKWDETLRDELASAQVIIALIGEHWLDIRDDGGRRRLDDPDDYVRLEIEHGIGRERVRLVPVLLDGSSLPEAKELPESLAPLVQFQAFSLSDATWDKDIKDLHKSIEEDVWRVGRIAALRAPALSRGRGLVVGGRQARGHLRRPRTYDCPDLDLGDLASSLAAFYAKRRLETHVVNSPRGVVVQAKAGKVRSVGGMTVALTADLRQEHGKLVVELGPGRWADKALATAVSPWIPPLLWTAAYGVWLQVSLPLRTFRFVSQYVSERASAQTS